MSLLLLLTISEFHFHYSLKYRSGRIARRKRSSQNFGKYNKVGRSKRTRVNYIQNILKQLEAKTEEVNNLLTPKKLIEVCYKKYH